MAVGVARRTPRWWTRRGVRMAAAVAVASLAAHGGPPAALAAPAEPVESAQEMTLQSLGLPSRELFGASNAVAVFFPPPAAPLAPAGSLLRLFLAHSPVLDPTASTAAVSVNGEELAVLELDAGSVDGAVAEVRVPTAVLHPDTPNLLELRFELRVAGRPATRADDLSAAVRLENQTLLRYQLYGPPGTPPPARLDAYPFPLAGARAIGPARLGLVLPERPTDADLASGLGLVADLARRSPGQVAPQVVTTDQLDWLRAAGSPVLAVGPEGRLPAADPLLRAAGFASAGSGWVTPDGRALAPEDGLLAAVTSPWDGHSPLLLVTGAGDAAVGRAAAALARPGALPRDGSYAVVRPGRPPAPVAAAPAPGGTVAFPALGVQGVQVRAGGRRSVSLAFTAPAVDPTGAGDLVLDVAHSPWPAGQRSW